MTISEFWKKIIEHEGETFYTVTGLEFTYKLVSENAICTNRTHYNLTKSNFEKALSLCPISKPGDISQKVRGGSYVYSLIDDKRMQ